MKKKLKRKLKVIAISLIAFSTIIGASFFYNQTPVRAEHATGGTITTDGDYTVHTFTSSGTFTPDVDMEVEYLVDLL